MKKILFAIMIVALSISAAFGQEPSLFVSQSTHYKVYSELSALHAEETAKKMDAFFKLFNETFHFPVDRVNFKMNVRIFSTKERFNNYLEKIIDGKKDSFVYLQYNDPKKSELIGFRQPNENFDESLLRHGCIQFVKSFVKNPPEWILKGFALYFENSTYEKEHQVAVFQENLSWLNTLKSKIRTDDTEGLIPLQSFLNPSSALLRERGETYHAQSWAVVTFLKSSSNKNYNRLLWDAVSALDPEASENENVRAVNRRSFQWVNTYLLINDFKNYILTMKTFPEVVEEGIELYSAGDYEKAEEVLLEAILLDGSHYLPYYYLGLINYSRKDYSLAEYYYQSSLMLGADKALIHYALGVNAFSNGRMEDAENYLQEAVDLNREKYGEKTTRLLQRIEERRIIENDHGM